MQTCFGLRSPTLAKANENRNKNRTQNRHRNEMASGTRPVLGFCRSEKSWGFVQEKTEEDFLCYSFELR